MFCCSLFLLVSPLLQIIALGVNCSCKWTKNWCKWRRITGKAQRSRASPKYGSILQSTGSSKSRDSISSGRRQLRRDLLLTLGTPVSTSCNRLLALVENRYLLFPLPYPNVLYLLSFRATSCHRHRKWLCAWPWGITVSLSCSRICLIPKFSSGKQRN